MISIAEAACLYYALARNYRENAWWANFLVDLLDL
jgi:hypothetical protein